MRGAGRRKAPAKCSNISRAGRRDGQHQQPGRNNPARKQRNQNFHQSTRAMKAEFRHQTREGRFKKGPRQEGQIRVSLNDHGRKHAHGKQRAGEKPGHHVLGRVPFDVTQRGRS